MLVAADAGRTLRSDGEIRGADDFLPLAIELSDARISSMRLSKSRVVEKHTHTPLSTMRIGSKTGRAAHTFEYIVLVTVGGCAFLPTAFFVGAHATDSI